jgi:ATP-dependent DNA ligase
VRNFSTLSGVVTSARQPHSHGLEGIIDKPHRFGRGDWWQKITCKRRDSFVIVGFEPSTVPGHFGRLLLAARKGDGLIYVGGCGTGFRASYEICSRAWRRKRRPWR